MEKMIEIIQTKDNFSIEELIIREAIKTLGDPFKNLTVKEVAKEVPLDRLLVETDDPYLTPVPFRGKENRPSYVKYVLKEIAEIKEMDYQELEKIKVLMFK